MSPSEASRPEHGRDAAGAEQAPAAIRFESASIEYGRVGRRVRALDGVDLVVPRGQVLSLLGPSGSGKSTLLRLAAGLEPPGSGTVSLLGHDLAALAPTRRCEFRLRRVGQVFQGGRLLPGIDVRENVALPLAFLGAGRARSLARADEVLDRVGVARAARTRMPASLPGCDRQRVAIARAVVAGPEVLVADEPSGSLDSRSARAILDLLASLASETVLTLVVATHATEVATLGHRTIVLRDGRLVRDVSTVPRRPATVCAARLVPA